MEVNKIYVGDWVKVAETLPSGIAHLIITSPPYWGQRNYGVDGQLGLEKTPEEHIEKLVFGFRELRRVLRDDGVLFLNYGDKYGGGNNKSKGKDKKMIQKFSARGSGNFHSADLRSGDLIGLAWRLALALQADGWYLRSDIIWAKALSFCAKYSGSTMPESLNGWRWERHRIKVKKSKHATQWNIKGGQKCMMDSPQANRGTNPDWLAQWKDCPGCPKCAPDGLILRKGSWRPTRAHEYLFLLAKTSNYYADMEAVREEYNYDGRHDTKLKPTKKYGSRNYGQNPNTCHTEGAERWPSSGRNLRDVYAIPNELEELFLWWLKDNEGNIQDVFCINPQAYPDSHYATFPEKLVEPCIKVGTSEKGCCPKCGAQWARIVQPSKEYAKELGQSWHDNNPTKATTLGQRKGDTKGKRFTADYTTLGWLPTCTHCIICDKIGLTNKESYEVHYATQRPRKTKDMAASMEQETLGNQSRAPEESGVKEKEVFNNMPTLPKAIHGKEKSEILQPTMRSTLDVGKQTGEPLPSDNRQVSTSRKDSQAPSNNGSKNKTEAITNGVSTPSKRTKGRQQSKQSDCRISSNTCSATHDKTKKHSFAPYEPVPAVVLDPFCGTATVCAVAAKLGRNYIGIELNPDYVKNQAEYRVAEGETGISKGEQKAGQMALFTKGL